MNSFLKVEQSLSDRKWLGPALDVQRAADAMVQRTGLPGALCLVLARLGVTKDNANEFLNPKLRDLMPDPRSLRDMDIAASRFVAAAQDGQRIAIFADYDVDGGASAALLIHWLRDLGVDVGARVTLYVPDRIDEGYGPNPDAMAKLAQDHDLIICVDCGTLSHEALAVVPDTDVIILDHHLGGETLPVAKAVVNPNRQDENGDLAHLCAAAVVFLMLVEAGRQMRDSGRPAPDLMQMLDLVALATIADVAPLTGVNRAFVRQGLKIMGRRSRVGLVALADAAGVDGPITTYSLGYVLGPRINAGGRVGKADLGARLLASDDAVEAAAMAERLNELNRERRDIEAEVRNAAMIQAETRGLDAPLVWAAGEGWHPGVVGIVASRLKEATNRPSVVIGLEAEEGKGSGRSVSGVDLGAAIQRLASEGLLLKGGGHRMAAGLTVERGKLTAAMDRLTELVARQGAGKGGPADLYLDGLLMSSAISVELVRQLEDAGPFGAGAPDPRFAFANQAIGFAKRVGENHLKLSFSDGGGPRLDAIAFGAFDGPLGPTLENHGGAKFHIVGRLDINRWQGRETVQLLLDDAAKVEN